MKRRIIWILVSCLMVTALIMASCGPAEVEEEEEEEVVVEEEEEEVEEEVVEEEELLPPEVPKYGGTYTCIMMEPMGFDPAYTLSVECRASFICNDELLKGDWAKGLSGTGKTDWLNGFVGRVDLLASSLATSWDMPDDETIIFHLRKGVHFWDKPPANGREFTAKDAAWNIEREWNAPMGFLRVTNKPEDSLISATALDKYTLELKVPAHVQGLQWVINGAQLHFFAPEVVDVYGDMKDWRNLSGTGAFMLTDYVVGSSMTMIRHPNYWDVDPVHPENKIPYIDTLRHLFITDASTTLAALRTGKIDTGGSGWEDAEITMEQCPDLKYIVSPGIDDQLYFRVDKEELPFKDLRVRQALTLAINQQELIDDYYEGNADMLGTPFPPYKTWEPFYTPLGEQPEAVQELFEFHPDKARALLAEAGYPDGFKCTILSGSPTASDFLSIIREYFLDVGVEMDIDQAESGVYRSMRRARTYEQGIYTTCPTAAFPWKMHNIRSESFDCHSYFEHEYTRAIYDELNLYYGKDADKVAALLKESVPFTLEQCVGIWLPVPHGYRFWWPWVQNYHGEGSLGYDDQGCISHYLWIDEALKESMGY